MPGPLRPLDCAGVCSWIGVVLLAARLPLPSGLEPLRQLALGALTWALLVLLARRESPLVRVQTGVVVLLATTVEYTFSPLLHAYSYTIGTVPLYVPPGHGLVYLAALAFSRGRLVSGHLRAAVALTVAAGGAWALAGVAGLLGQRHDVLGAFWFACLLGFLAWGRSRPLYVGLFLVVGFLEVVGTSLGVWAWAPLDPVLGVIGQGNPPSGASGGYGWFDLFAILAGPRLLTLLTSLPWPVRVPSATGPAGRGASGSRRPDPGVGAVPPLCRAGLGGDFHLGRPAPLPVDGDPGAGPALPLGGEQRLVGGGDQAVQPG